jgi:hypothetical protein
MIMTTKQPQKLPSRESETREKVSRRKPWAPTTTLDAPPASKSFKHRWIRAEVVGQLDNKNVSARLREGWEFVRSDEYPDTEWPQLDSGKYEGVIAVGGLMLARIPEEIVEERNAYFHQLTKDKDEAIANDPLKDQHPSMPISSERSTRVSFGGKKPS